MAPELIAALEAAERAQKPRIRQVTPPDWPRVQRYFECIGSGRRALGTTPDYAYRSWRAAAQWGGA